MIIKSVIALINRTKIKDSYRCYLCGDFKQKDYKKHSHLDERKKLQDGNWGLVCPYCGVDHWPIDCGGAL